MRSDAGLYDVEATLLTCVVSAAVLFGLVRALQRGRPRLAIGTPMAVAFGIRVLAAVGISATSAAQEIRGPDEIGFLANARAVVDQGLTAPHSLHVLATALQNWTFALQLRLLPDAPDLALRMTQIGVAVAGLILLATGVYELAGPRRARWAAWLLALEPTGVFFSSVLHKEPLMFLAAGLVAFGGARLWTRGRLTALLPMLAGALLALAVREYVGLALAASAGLVAFHAAVTRHHAGRAPRLAAVLVLGALVGLPVAWGLTSRERLAELQQSQDANSSDASNLALGHVDFSSRQAVVLHLPRRMADVLTRPYPWQIQNTSQRLGVIGTLVALALLAALAVALVRAPHVMKRAGPLLYPGLALLASYSLSAGNAGTAFRYRTHIVALILCLLAVLWRTWPERQRMRVGGAVPRPPILARP